MSLIELDLGSTKTLVWVLFAVALVVLIWQLATWGAVLLGAVIVAVVLLIFYAVVTRTDRWLRGGLG